MPDLDVMIRETLVAYIDGPPTRHDQQALLAEPVFAAPPRARTPMLAGVALLAVLLVGGLAAWLGGSRRSPEPTREPSRAAGTEVTATWVPPGFERVRYNRTNRPEVPQFDSEWDYRGPNGSSFKVSRHESSQQAEYDRAVPEVIRADQNPSPGWYAYRLLTGDTLFVVQGVGVPDASEQLRRVIEGLRINDAGNCLQGAVVRTGTACAAGSIDVPEDTARHDIATTSTTNGVSSASTIP